MSFTELDQRYMKRALELAERGLGLVSPNPLVGCVVAHNDSIVGEGWHGKVGGPHAEVNAINDVQDKSVLKDSTVYVTLEPCSHYGRTPPCSDLLIEMGVSRVVIAQQDPNEKVNGRGIARLQEHGISIETGLLLDEARFQNRRFITNIEKKRPYIVLKWAQTADGFIARKNYDSKWISNSSSRQLVHKWRSEEDGILVGSNTVKYDDPTLNVREWIGRDPKRVYLDRSLGLSSEKLAGDDVFCINELKEGFSDRNYIKVKSVFDIGDVLESLMKNDINSLIVEGGTEVLNSFLTSDLWDEARVFTSDKKFEDGIEAPKLEDSHASEELILKDILRTYYN